MKFNAREDNPTEPVWRQLNTHVNFKELNNNLLSYLDSLPTEVQKNVYVTSSTGGEHSELSRHGSGAALDIRIHKKENPYLDPTFMYLYKDAENRKDSNITILDPVHGTAPHIHISYGAGSENDLDFSYGSKWDNYINKNEKSKLLWEEAKPYYGLAQTTESKPHSEDEYLEESVDFNQLEDKEAQQKALQEYEEYNESLKNKKPPEVLEDAEVKEVLAMQDFRKKAASLIKDYLSLDYDFANYSKSQPQQTQGVQYAENGGMIRYPNVGKVYKGEELINKITPYSSNIRRDYKNGGLLSSQSVKYPIDFLKKYQKIDT